MVIQSYTPRLGSGKNFRGLCFNDGISLFCCTSDSKILYKHLTKTQDGKFTVDNMREVASADVCCPISQTEALIVKAPSAFGKINY